MTRPLQHQLAHARGIRLALHGLHDRTDHGADGVRLALADLFDPTQLQGLAVDWARPTRLGRRTIRSQSRMRVTYVQSTYRKDALMTVPGSIDHENKDARMNVRLAPSQASLIRRAAEADNKSVSEFVIGSAASAAEHVLADRRRFAIDAAAWRSFSELLERPAVYKPRLAELLASDDRFVD